MDTTILRLPDVLRTIGLTRSRFYDALASGLFTKSVSIGQRAVGWPRYEVEAVNAARISGMSDADVRKLVNKLHRKRKNVLEKAIAELDQAAA